MNTLNQLHHGLERAREYVNEGWNQLRRGASRALTRFHRREDRDGLQTADEQSPQRAPAWGLLAAEMRESDDEIVVRLESPGMDPENFDIEVVDDLLSIRGEKRFQADRSSGDFRITECAYGAFERTMPLPGPVDSSRTRAQYRRGVLQINLPKAAGARKRKITVAAG